MEGERNWPTYPIISWPSCLAAMSFISKDERQKCWDSRDRYWDCLDTNAEERERCLKLRQAYENSCPAQWQNPVANASCNGWGDHRANHMIPPFWLDDRPPLLRHVGVRPAVGWSV
ncbi:hypothetical protein ANN_22167 [Periplaneta americana]|uniref:Uncharacterized protein n=1 Tax=Periplaneta americana TaxID=6978 RepID=A0ABQ8S7N0_PERAM|nr:hypothetical protein ANN_22167 [Periplaneta americana]